MELARDFVFKPITPIATPIHFPFPILPNPLGPLQNLPGTWTGKGFNTIWRPNSTPGQDRFLELDLTSETLEFSAISGPIPNRGLLQPDMNMFGVHYLQQIKNSNLNAGIHIEPGIWAVVPATTNPAEAPTVVRMASIPHGTTMLAQGTATAVNGPPVFPTVNIVPFAIGGVPPPGLPADPFVESHLGTPTVFRSPPAAMAGVTQPMVDNPNSVLQAAIAGQTITHTQILKVSTKPALPILGGGTSNTAFLQGGSPNSAKSNANAVEVDATFWIETVKGAGGAPDFMQLQYSQVVILNFNGLSWPHVSVATLRRVISLNLAPQIIDPRLPLANIPPEHKPIPDPDPAA